MNNQPKPLTVLAALVIDFFRWSQLTPMILMWAFILGILLALLAIGNQDAIFDLIGRVGQWIASLPWIGPKFVVFLEARSKDSVIGPDLAGMDLKSVALTAWGFISAGFMFLAWIAGRVDRVVHRQCLVPGRFTFAGLDFRDGHRASIRYIRSGQQQNLIRPCAKSLMTKRHRVAMEFTTDSTAAPSAKIDHISSGTSYICW